MARKPRLDYAAAIYRVMIRGAWRETAEAKAERILPVELKRLNWTVDTLARKRKGEPGKVRIAQRLRAEPTMTREWIAGRLRMGTRTHRSHWLYWQGRQKGK